MNAAEIPASARPTVQMVRQSPEDLISLYSNQVNITTTLYDFRFTFGETTEATEETHRVKELVRIFMSPQHAKELAAIMTNLVADYERRFGLLPVARPSAGDEVPTSAT